MNQSRLVFALGFALAASLVFAGPSAAQEKGPAPHETSTEVPALTDFHEVIYEIWHDAWPSKNTAKLAQLLPQVKKGVTDIAAVELPGILREKKPAWTEGVKKLQTIAGEYEAAASAKDDKKLLDAAEKLHMQFEQLARVLRPPLRELEAFHSVLYVLYHYDLQAYTLEKVKTRVSELEAKLGPLAAAKLPEKLTAKQEAFGAARKRLAEAVATLKAACTGGDEKKVKGAVEEVHSAYQAAASIFE
jgi:hypothetical protein